MPKFCVKRGGDGTRYAYSDELFARGDMDVVEVAEEGEKAEAPKGPKSDPKVKVEIED